MASLSVEVDGVGQLSSISWRKIDPADEEVPGMLQDISELDDFRELIKVTLHMRAVQWLPQT